MKMMDFFLENDGFLLEKNKGACPFIREVRVSKYTDMYKVFNLLKVILHEIDVLFLHVNIM